MFRKKPEELTRKITLDELLNNPEEYYESKVKIDNLVIDNIVYDWYYFCIIAHNEEGHKRGVFMGFKESDKSKLIAHLSKPDDKISIIGRFHKSYTVYPRLGVDYTVEGKNISICELENSRLSNIDF